ncbi:MAG: phosphonate C-P lyase system protein PhnH [Lachnospiraceae bacterium]|nr:phosphonate C-P lyase system protein PhnH [Lachnospiraceae bacterium]
MKPLYTFDETFDSQKIFRTLLEAMSNPGRKLSLASGAEKLYGACPQLLAAAMTLLDSKVSFHVYGSPELEEQIVLLTHAEKEEAQKADYLFVTGASFLEEAFRDAKPGTLADPHLSATLVILCEDGNEEELVLEGPGIKGKETVSLPAEAKKTLQLREARCYEYPAGVDMIYITESGQVFCIPRLVKREDV